jgi:hypothetical protein
MMNLNKYTKNQLLIKYKNEFNYIYFNNKYTKNQIIELIQNKYKFNKVIISIKYNINNNKLFNKIITELILLNPKDKNRKVCKNCYELNHNINSIYCPINIYTKKKLINKIKKYIINIDIFEDNIENILNNLSIKLNISLNYCKSIYSEIESDIFLNRPIDFNKLKIIINNNLINCYDCNINIFNINNNNIKIWKNNYLCDYCWSLYNNDRDLLWDKIYSLNYIKKCSICNKIKLNKGERFHFDHLNMFNKYDSICNMINNGTNINIIFNEINKCKITCYHCHNIISYIEQKLGFTKIKQNLTRKLNNKEISIDEYNIKIIFYQNLYKQKFNYIYQNLSIMIQSF